MVFCIFYVKLEFPDWVLQHMVLFLLGSSELTKEFYLFCLFYAEVKDHGGGREELAG